MQEKIWNFINKSNWGEGAWQNEPDKVQWSDYTTQLPCLAVRNPASGNWCGYVGVTAEHPFFGSLGWGTTTVPNNVATLFATIHLSPE